MKKLSFSNTFLIAAWIIFIGGRNIATSILLLAASIYSLINVIPKIRKELRSLCR
nr:MAG TPA: hypothetical protein [Caudoviricetes sp.]